MRKSLLCFLILIVACNTNKKVRDSIPGTGFSTEERKIPKESAFYRMSDMYGMYFYDDIDNMKYVVILSGTGSSPAVINLTKDSLEIEALKKDLKSK